MTLHREGAFSAVESAREVARRLSVVLRQLGIGMSSERHDDGAAVRPADQGGLGGVQDPASLLRAIMDATPNALMLADRRGRIVHANIQAADLLGYMPGELDGRAIEALVPDRYRGHHAALREGYMDRPVTRRMLAGPDLVALRKDGSEVEIEVGLNALGGTSGEILVALNDATKRRAAERQAQSATVLAQSIINSAPFSIIATDSDGIIIEVNKAAEQMLWYTREELIGRVTPEAIHDAGEMAVRAREVQSELGGELPSGVAALVGRADRGIVDGREWTYVRKDGSRFPVHLTIAALRDAAGKVSGYLGIAYDITERKRADDYIRHIAHHDVLTGLPNRLLMQDRLEMAIARAKRFGTRVGVLLIDLDRFKRINDTLGHHVGDQLLVAIARALQECVRATDTVVRMGGDEFVVLVPDARDAEDVVATANRIVARLTTPMTVAGGEMSVSGSVGIALLPDHGDTMPALLMNADMAMYEAKRQGRARALVFTPELAHHVTRQHELEQALTGAVMRGELFVEYQPQIDLVSGQVTGVEALMRWRHPKFGLVPPDQFIPLAEETGLIGQLSVWMLNTACADLTSLRRSTGRDLRLAVNVSPRHIEDERFLEMIGTALEATGLPASALEVEITEAALLANSDTCLRVLGALRDSGSSVAIDDFGTGFSSLSYLIRFPIDRLKIDRSFIHDLNLDESRAIVVSAIIAMGRKLGIHIVAEGVEAPSQHRWLVAQGCQEAQGYLYARPVRIERLDGELERIAGRMAELGRSPPDEQRGV